MKRTRSVAVACRISRSGFSGERVFRVSNVAGEDYIGVAPVHYFLTLDGRPLLQDAAIAPGVQVEGQIVALLIENGGGEASVAFPGGELTRVKMDQVRHVPSEVASDVPV